jgi:Na+-translocating ferredoxin:NAD+ oxidoreductase RnfD subunit
MQIFKSIKAQLIAYLTCFAVFLAFKDKSSAFLCTAGLCVFFAVGIESAVLYLKTRSFKLTESSVITGLIIGFVLSSDQTWWKFFAACAIAILSKSLIVFKKKHIFNPAALGVFLCLILFAATTQWQGTYVWYILVPAGIYFAKKTGKLKIVASYFFAALVLFGIQALLQKTSLWNILGYLSYFYIFVMVIEPKTSPVKPGRQVIFGVGIAVLIFILIQLGVRFDVELFSLLVLNMAVLLLDKITQKKATIGVIK